MLEKFPNVVRRAKPEVLAPAGSLDTLKIAVDFGADAVYCGGKAFGMRSAPKNLSLDDFAQAVEYAHARNARVFVTCNILPKSSEIKEMNEYMGQLGEIGVDALIVSDIGVLMAAREVAPNTEIHISTQAGITNYQAANALASLGASRVVLARELDLEAIRQIRANVSPELEIEAFVHGSMCMAFSGRCLISQHVTGRDANHGDCAQSCRWKYHVVEEKRPNQFIPVEITDEGTYLFNSQDMNLLPHVPEILDAGITSLKIEGRAKSAYYVAAMANAYKQAVNAYLDRPDPNAEVVYPHWLLEEPYKVTHREYSTGFYYPENPASESIVSGAYINEWRWVGDVLGYDSEAKLLHIKAKNKITPNMTLEFLVPGIAPIECKVPETGLLDAKKHSVELINHPTKEFYISCEVEVPAGAIIRTQTRF